MKVLVLYEYPPPPGGLATQGDMLYRGLKEIGVDAYPVNPGCAQEKEWYYHWFKPDVVVGIGYWDIHLSWYCTLRNTDCSQFRGWLPTAISQTT